MSKTAVPLAEARALAAEVCADLAPFCERLEVAGSLRRESPTVGDLEFVAIPRFEAVGLWGDQQHNALWGGIHGYEKYRFTKGDNPEGRYFQMATAEGVQVDIFTAHPDNFGWIWLIRTGPAAFSHSVLTEWKRQKCLGRDQRGSLDGYLVDRYGTVFPTPDEQSVFAYLGIRFIEPRDRTDDALWRAQHPR